MSFIYEMNKIMLVDGILFIIPGISLLLVPSPQSLLKDKVDSKIALPAMKDVRSLLGAAYLSIGFTIIMLGGIVNEKAELNSFARFRAISLIFIIYALIRQLLKKKWKWSGYRVMYLILYCLLFLVYAFLGFVDPMSVY